MPCEARTSRREHCARSSPCMTRPRTGEARSWSGWPRTAGFAGAGGRERAGTEHVLLALVDGPPGPARSALSSAGVVTGVVHRALEAIVGPDAAALERVPPDCVRPGDRVTALLARAAALAKRGAIGTGSSLMNGPTGLEDAHVLFALVTSDEPNLALLVLGQLEAVEAVKQALLSRH